MTRIDWLASRLAFIAIPQHDAHKMMTRRLGTVLHARLNDHYLRRRRIPRPHRCAHWKHRHMAISRCMRCVDRRKRSFSFR